MWIEKVNDVSGILSGVVHNFNITVLGKAEIVEPHFVHANSL